jgi:hypothetical protein
VRITRNKIKNNLKACGIIARRSKRERKKAVEALRRAKEFILMDMLEAIPNPEKTTNADIDLQLREALISTNTDTDIIDPGLIDSIMNLEVQEGNYNDIAMQADFVRFGTECDYLDVDDNADTRLFQL